MQNALLLHVCVFGRSVFPSVVHTFPRKSPATYCAAWVREKNAVAASSRMTCFSSWMCFAILRNRAWQRRAREIQPQAARKRSEQMRSGAGTEQYPSCYLCASNVSHVGTLRQEEAVRTPLSVQYVNKLVPNLYSGRNFQRHVVHHHGITMNARHPAKPATFSSSNPNPHACSGLSLLSAVLAQPECKEPMGRYSATTKDTAYTALYLQRVGLLLEKLVPLLRSQELPLVRLERHARRRHLLGGHGCCG